jgi:mono/diheme cytochrome c family protein
MKTHFALGSLCLLALAACTSGPSGPSLSPEEREGQRLFQQTCAACHTASGTTVVVGPPLAGIATLAETRVAGVDAYSYLKESILHPNAFINEGFTDIMPKNFGQILSPDQIESLIAFLLTLP